MPRRTDPWSRKLTWLSDADEEPGSLRSLTIAGIVDFVSGGVLRYGKKTHDSTATGFWMGVDQADHKAKLHFGNASYYIYWTGTNLRIKALYLTVDENGVRIDTRKDVEARYRFTLDGETTGEVMSLVDTWENTVITTLRAVGTENNTDAVAVLEAKTYSGATASISANAAGSPAAWITNAVKIIGTQDAGTYNYIELSQTNSTPTVSSTSSGLIVTKNGSNKLELRALFPSGVTVLLATQP